MIPTTTPSLRKKHSKKLRIWLSLRKKHKQKGWRSIDNGTIVCMANMDKSTNKKGRHALTLDLQECNLSGVIFFIRVALCFHLPCAADQVEPSIKLFKNISTLNEKWLV